MPGSQGSPDENIRPWPTDADALIELQDRSGALPEQPSPATVRGLVGGCFVCFTRGLDGPGHPGEPGWAAAAVTRGARPIGTASVRGEAGATYRPGLLALREGPLLEAAVRALATKPHVLLVNATGRDHPRRFGLASHLGAVLDVPTVGVTHRPLVAEGTWPPDVPLATSPLVLASEVVGFWVRVLEGVRPLAVHAGWRTSPREAVEIVHDSIGDFRTPEPLRLARERARLSRQHDREAQAD